MKSESGFVFVSHAKAGSTWIDGILRTLFCERVGPRAGGHLPQDPIPTGAVISAAFVTAEELGAHATLSGWARFVVIRDLRDTLVSRYFSVRYSHSTVGAPQMIRIREKLSSMDFEEGLLYLFENGLHRSEAIQRSWVAAGELMFRYEDLICNPETGLGEIFHGYLGLDLPRGALTAAVRKNSFESKFGRPLGQVDERSHGRVGTPGDWRNHFTPLVARAFHERFGETLALTGYAEGDEWVREVEGRQGIP